jgi:hypothetical protein
MRMRDIRGTFQASVVFVLVASATTARAQEAASTELSGSGGGRAFADSAPPAGARVFEVRIATGERIDSVQIEYSLPRGRSLSGPRHGGSGGRLVVFRLDPDEFITGLSGRCGDTVDSLRIHTNRRTSELFGGSGGDREYRIDVPRGNEAVGFAGRAGNLIDAIGLVYVARPVRGFFGSPGRRPGQAGDADIAGGDGGSPFTDPEPRSDTRLAEVRVYAGDHVDVIQAVYVDGNGRLVEGARHGGGGGRVTVFRLDPDEYVTGLSGRHGDVIDSLRIHTNRRTSELFGGSGGERDFRIDVPSGRQAVGFTGRAGRYLDAIGLTHGTITDFRRRGPGRRP